jgi:hypothetical protein
MSFMLYVFVCLPLSADAFRAVVQYMRVLRLPDRANAVMYSYVMTKLDPYHDYDYDHDLSP